MPKDFYQTLGIDKNASEEEVKKAFRKAAHQHHPDKTGGDDSKFKEINEAYQVLSDKDKRAKYDQFGPDFEKMGGFGGGAGGGNPFGGFDFSQGFGGGNGGFNVNFNGQDMGDLGDLFSGMFGGGGGQREKRGRHIEMDVKISFLEAVFGVERELHFTRQLVCDDCSGSGAEKGAKTKQCEQCQGKGKVLTYQRTMLGTMQTVGTCPTCEGAGTIPEKKCRECHGTGRVKGERKLSVKVPAGVSNGDNLRVGGEGEPGERGARPGDLYLTIRVAADKRFQRDGFDIVSQLEISLPQAVLGATVDIETVDGPVDFKIPAGTQSHTVFRLRDKGVPHLKKSGRGDHLVQVTVAIPSKLTKAQRKAMEEWEK